MGKNKTAIVLPMLCVEGTQRDVERCEAEKMVRWWAERKFDGVRATIQNGKMYDRRGKEITSRFPEFVGLSAIKGFVDGEIVLAEGGSFSDVAGRMHLRDKAKQRLLARLHPCIFTWWWTGLSDVSNADWDWAGMMGASPAWMRKAERGCPKNMWERAEREGWEGIILKCASEYRQGYRSPAWMKVKRFVEKEHWFSKVEVTPRGVVLEDEGGRRVNVNGAEAKVLANIMKERGRVCVRVQYLPQKESDAWRFPSYRGIVEEK